MVGNPLSLGSKSRFDMSKSRKVTRRAQEDASLSGAMTVVLSQAWRTKAAFVLGARLPDLEHKEVFSSRSTLERHLIQPRSEKQNAKLSLLVAHPGQRRRAGTHLSVQSAFTRLPDLLDDLERLILLDGDQVEDSLRGEQLLLLESKRQSQPSSAKAFSLGVQGG